MKYAKQLALGLLCLTPRADANNVTSHTFFSALPVSNLITNLTLNLLVDQDKEDGRALNKPTLQFAAFGGQSTNANGLRDFFFFNHKNSLLMNEAPLQEGGPAATQNALPGTGQDLIGSDFNIQTFNTAQASSITINPKQSVVGGSLSLRLPFAQKFWATLEIPVMQVKNNLNLVETFTYGAPFNAATNGVGLYDETTGRPSIPVATMIQAFRQDGMLYGRIEGIQKKAGIADMTLKVGVDIKNQTDLYLTGYAGIIFPTGNRPNAEYMFEAIVGNNHHWALLGGTYLQLFMNESKKTKTWLSMLFESEYLFENTQMRSFDLYNGPWTRYMQIFRNEGARTLEEDIGAAPTAGARTWGINYFTQKVRVTPGYQGTFNINLGTFGKKWNGTLGLNTIVRQAENVTLFEQWKIGPQIASLPLYGVSMSPGSLEPLRNISTLPSYAAQYGSTGIGGTVDQPFYVQEANLNLDSAAHPAARAHTAYATLGYYRQTDHPQNWQLGTSYEFSGQNTILHRWMIWGSLQITF